MNDASGPADTVSDGPSGPYADASTTSVNPTEAPGLVLSNGPSLVEIGGEQPAQNRQMNMASLLNAVADDVVGGSDHDGDKEAEASTASPCDPTVGSAVTGRVGHDVDLLLSLTRSSSVSPRATASRDDAMSPKAVGDDAPRAAEATTEASDGGNKNAADEAMVSAEDIADEAPIAGRRPSRQARVPPRFTIDNTSTKPHAPKSKRAAAPPAADAVVNELPASPSGPPARASRSREKRPRSTPSPVRAPPPPKKTKTTSSRPKRAAAAAVSNYVDITGNEGEDSEEDAIMVIANHDGAASAKAPPSHVANGTGQPKHVTKRKTMSQEQYNELIAERRDAGASSRVEYQAPSVARPYVPTSGTTGAPLHPCEFCRQRHSAHTTYLCQACRRVYHDKCFVNAFRSKIHDTQSIEDQMAELSLYRPNDRTAVLRCTSCQAAFIDFFKNQGVHWDCQCPTCTNVPEKILDYRMVSLKRIVDEHNLEIAQKKEKKGGGTAKTPAAKAPATAVKPSARNTARSSAAAPAPVVAAPTTTNAPPRGRGNKRTRNEEASSTEVEVTPAPEVDPASIAKVPAAESKKKPPTASRGGCGRRRPTRVITVESDESDEMSTHPENSQPMDIDAPAENEAPTPATNGTSTRETVSTDKIDPGDASMEADNGDPGAITLETLEELVAITKENDETWSFRVACSSSQGVNVSGAYKEAIFYWHPQRHQTLTCCCCNKEGQSIRWFVEHTDPSLLCGPGADDELIDVYSYMFVLQRDGEMLPLQQVINLIRETHRKTVGNLPRARGGRRPSATATKKEANPGRQEALELLNKVKFLPCQIEKRGPAKKKTVPPMFSCEVLCAELGKWVKPIGPNGTMLRNCIADCHVGDDVFKTGTFDVCGSAKTLKSAMIYCNCCKTRQTAMHFAQHLRGPLLKLQEEEVKRLKEEMKRRDEYQQETEDSWSNDVVHSTEGESINDLGGNGKMIRPIVCVSSIPLRDGLSAVRLEAFLDAIGKLGNQTEINKAIAAIVNSYEPPVVHTS